MKRVLLNTFKISMAIMMLQENVEKQQHLLLKFTKFQKNV